jgi:hypothetical protein
MHFCPPCGNILHLEVPTRSTLAGTPWLCHAPDRYAVSWLLLGTDCSWTLTDVPARYAADWWTHTFLLPDMPVRVSAQGDGEPHALQAPRASHSHDMVAGAQVYMEVKTEHKAVDDVLGGPEAWKNADQTDGECAIFGSHWHAAHLACPGERWCFAHGWWQHLAANATTIGLTFNKFRSGLRMSR